MQQHIQNWKIENKRNVSQRLSWIRGQQDGVVVHYNDGIEEILVVKKDNLVFLHFVGESSTKQGDKAEKVVSDAMSLIDVSNPLMLHSPYAHAMLMSLAFIPEPSQLYMLGFGGGRIPMILHHYLPQLVIESSEQSEGVVSLLEMCFGIKANEQSGRIKVDTVNGREHLQQFPQQLFDIILLDTFTGAGVHPNELSSTDFYRLCSSRLSSKGVVATNLVSTSPDYHQKVDDFCDSFKYCYSFSHENNHVYLGSDVLQMNRDELVEKAQLADEKYQFDFKLADQASSVVVLN
jgi:spermidine synthase